MKEKFPALFAALQVEEMQMQDGGAFMNEGLLQTLNEKIEAMQKAEADAKALAESLTAEKNDLTAKVEALNANHQKAIDDLTAEHQKAVDDLNAAHATTIEEKDKAIEELNGKLTEKDETIAGLQSDVEGKQKDLDEKAATLKATETELEGAKASLTTAQNTIAERDQQITDLNAQITELQNNPGAEPAAGAAPQNNGGGADAPGYKPSCYVYDNNLSPAENWAAEEEWNKAHGVK